MEPLQNLTPELSQPLTTETISEESRDIPEYVRRFGGSASITLIDPSCQIFSTPHIDGIIGYRLESGCAIVFGDPLCLSTDLPLFVQAFHHYCEKQGWRIVYVGASGLFTRWAIEHGCGCFVEVGEELILDPFQNLLEGTKGRLLRNKVNQAHRTDLSIHEYKENAPELEEAIQQVGAAWLKTRRGPQIYLSNVHLFAERVGKRWFYAKHDEKIVGVLILHQLEARRGWVIQFLMRTPDAPIGTSEQLVISIAEILHAEGCSFLSFGVAQRENLGEIKGLSAFSEWLARTVFKLAKRLFHLDRRRFYWQKFQPKAEPCYLIFSESKIRLRTVISLMRALNVHI